MTDTNTNTNGHASRLNKAQRRLKTLALKQQLAEARIRLAHAERRAKAEELKTSHWWPQDGNPGRQQLHENLSRKRDQQTQLLEAKAAGKDISETALWGDWVGGYQDMLDRFRSPDGLLLSAISIAADRRYGAYWPFFRTWQELALLRGAARILYQTSALARGAVQGLISYIIGDGFTYRVVERPGAPQGLQTAAQEILDENRDLNDWPALEAECLRRDVRDGEWFLRDFPQPNGLTYTRTIGPEQLIQPSDSTLEEWSFGKQNPIGEAHDVQTVLAYNVCYDGNNTTGIVVPAENVIEHTSNVDRDVKRGIPDLSYDTYDFLKVAGRLIENMGEGSAIQAAVSEIRQWEGPVTGDQASDFVDANADYTVPNPWTGTSESVRQVRPGEVRDIPKGMTYVPPPFTQGSPVFIQVEQAVLRAVAVTWNAPEWITSGDAGTSSYASSLTEESPFIKTGKHKQNVVYKPRFLMARWRVLRNYCRAKGGIVVNGTKYDWAAIRKYLDIQCEPPSMETRNKLDEAQANATRIEGGWKSRQTVASEENLDWVDEKRNMKEYAEEFPDQPPPAAGGGKPGGGKTTPEVPKPPHPTTEGKEPRHKGKGPGGGQFTGNGGGGGGGSGGGSRQERQGQRDEARQLLGKRTLQGDSAAVTAAVNHLDALDNAARAGTGEGLGAKAASAAEAWADHWHKTGALLSGAGASKDDLADFDALRDRATAGISRKTARFGAAADKNAAAQAALSAHQEKEPAEPAEPDYPDEPKREDFATDAEHDTAVEKWNDDSEKMVADHEKVQERYEQAYERWDSKRERLDGRAEATQERSDERFGELEESLKQAHDELSNAADDVESELTDRLDREEQDDPDPDEED